MHQTLRENHPGIYNNLDKDFSKTLDISYKSAKNKILSTNNHHKQKKYIQKFTQSFNDNHLWVRWDSAPKKTVKNINKKFEIQNLTDHIAWITLPTFQLNKKQKTEFNTLIKNIPQLRSKKYLIIDLRGNRGGNSDYGSELINALFGKKYSDYRRSHIYQKTSVDWRASNENLKHIQNLIHQYPNSSWLKTVETGIKNSIDLNKKYYRESFSDQIQPKNTNPNPLKKFLGSIIIIIDQHNGSSALTFLDEIKMVTPHITLIGKTTLADRLYSELRVVRLPSDSGTFAFPIKVYRNSLRADNEPYEPDIPYHNIQDTISLQKFILQTIHHHCATQ